MDFAAINTIHSRAAAVEIVASMVEFIDDPNGLVTDTDANFSMENTIAFKGVMLSAVHMIIAAHNITQEEVMDVLARDEQAIEADWIGETMGNA